MVLESQFRSLNYNIDNNSAIITDKSNHGLKLRTITNNDSFLVINKSYYPGWKATLDNKPALIHQVNINQQGIVIPPGNHHIHLYYKPDSLRIGLIISATGYLIMFLGLFLFANKSLNIP